MHRGSSDFRVFLCSIRRFPRNVKDWTKNHLYYLGLKSRAWARLLKRVFDIDLEYCPQCGVDFKIIAAIEDPVVIAKILTHLGLPARAAAASLRDGLIGTTRAVVQQG